MKDRIFYIVTIVLAVFTAGGIILENFFGVTADTHTWLFVLYSAVFYGCSGYLIWDGITDMYKSRKTES